MPPKKKTESDKKSPKKGSPGKDSKKGSPGKDKKGSPAKNVVEEPPEEVRPPTPPPRLPPIGAAHCNVRRQHWYVQADKPDAKIQENHFHPYYALITSWGDIWVSDPPRRRICRYALNPLKLDIYKLGDIILRGHPYHMAQHMVTGRVFVILKSPSIPKVSILELAPETQMVENKIIFPFTPPVADPDLEKPLVVVDESPAMGLAVDDDLLFVLRSPIQKLLIFNLLKMKEVDKCDVRFNGLDKDNPTCQHVSTSGGIAVRNGQMYIACGREAGVLLFSVKKYMCYSVVDRVVVTLLGRLQEHRMMMPFGIAVDSLNMVLVTDYQWDYIRGYQSSGKEACSFGQWKTIEMRPHRPGHISVSKNGIVCVVCHRHNEVLVFVDQVIFQWYHDSLFYLDDVYSLRTVVDRMAVPMPEKYYNKAKFQIEGLDRLLSTKK